MTDLDGRTVVLTGAAGGIGREAIRALLAAGANVLAVDVSADRLAAVAAAARDAGTAARLDTLALDVRDADCGTRAVERAHARFGPVYALVNNAGLGRSSYWRRTDRSPAFWEVEPEVWRTQFAVNADAVFAMTRAVVPDLLARSSGRIVTVTTSLESMLNAGMSPYGPAKAAAEAFASVVANDLKDKGITSNVIIPGGATDTPMVLDRPGIPRTALLPPSVMVPPLLWLLGDGGAGTTGRRFLAYRWDPAIDPAEAALASGAPIAWASIAAGSKRDALADGWSAQTGGRVAS